MADASVVLLLAIACTAEIDLGAVQDEARERDECLLMLSVLQTRAQRAQLPIETMAMRYVSALKCAGRRCDTPRMQRIRRLGWSPVRPADWEGPWDGPRWLRRLGYVQRWLEQGKPNTGKTAACRRADHFGGSCKLATGACDVPNPCWRRVHCGPTRQAYYVEQRCPKGGVVDARIVRASLR